MDDPVAFIALFVGLLAGFVLTIILIPAPEDSYVTKQLEKNCLSYELESYYQSASANQITVTYYCK